MHTAKPKWEWLIHGYLVFFPNFLSFFAFPILPVFSLKRSFQTPLVFPPKKDATGGRD